MVAADHLSTPRTGGAMNTRSASIWNPRACGLLATIALVSACTLNAQIPTLSGGTRVKLWTRGTDAAITGRVFSQTGDTIRIASNEVVHVVPTTSIARIDVGSGRSRGAGAIRGAKIGALSMGGFCLVVCGIAYLADSTHEDFGSLAGFVGLSAYSGALWGAIIGAIVGTERFATAYSEHVALRIEPVVGGKRRIGLALRF